MSETNITANQAIQNAQNAIQRREKLAARRWAEVAVSLAPGREEPWLLMAAVASPLASVGYINQALKINPLSTRAQAGMKWAQKRVEEYRKEAELTPVLEAMPEQSAPATQAEEPTITPVEPAVPQQITPIAVPMPDTQMADTAPIRVAKLGESAQPTLASPANPKKPVSTLMLTVLPLLCLVILALAAWSAFPLVSYLSGQINPATAEISATPETPPTFSLPAGTVASVTPDVTEAVATTSADAPLQSPEAVVTDEARADAVVVQTSAPTIQPTTGIPVTATSAPATSTASEEPAGPTVEATPTALPTDTGPQVVTSAQDSQGGQSGTSGYTGNKRIVVSISEQHMYVYEGDNLVYSFIISTGIGGSTRAGTFSILDKIPNAYASTWNLWMPNWMGIYYAGYLENGIHALPILSNGSTLWEGYLGAPVSYGCVVLSTYDSQVLYQWAEVGVPVIIEY